MAATPESVKSVGNAKLGDYPLGALGVDAVDSFIVQGLSNSTSSRGYRSVGGVDISAY